MSNARSSAGGGSSLPRRRNGKEQACEPCRKAKIACDHGLPICTRCKRRKISEKCVYMSAPMTRTTGTGNTLTTTDPESSINRRQSEPITSSSSTSLAFPLTPNTGSSTVVSPTATSVTAVAAPLIYSRPSSTSKPRSTKVNRGAEASSQGKPGGFFGPTSFSAVFAENRENLGGSDDIMITNERIPYIHTNESLQAQMYQILAGKTSVEVDEPRLALGARVLLALPDENTCNFLLECYFDKCYDSWSYKRSTMAVSKSLWSAFGKDAKEPRRIEDVERISGIMCKNVTIPLEESDDWDTWIASITGDNLRWESIGSIFGALTSALLSLPERDCFFSTQRGKRMDRKHFAVEMKDCLQACITLSNYMDLLNILMVAMLSRNLILQTVLSGDTSLVCWRQLGDLVSATTALGLHRQVDRRITFLSEFKKFLFAAVFGFDKSASLLTGRPPALSYQYTRFELPLDLNDDVVIRGGLELEKAIAALDPNGWNTDGTIHASTRSRGHGFLAIVLNDVLELSLGDAVEVTGERIAYLLDRLDTTYNSFPSCLQLDLADPVNMTGSDNLFWTRLCLRLYMLEIRLILERLGHKQGVKDGQTMIDCAREILELVVLLWVQRDRFVERHCDYDWMLMCWGVPSSGVLCVELLKQMKQPSGVSTLKLPRSEIVQNLSLLIGFLEWVRPAAGNYLLCRRMSLLIKRILDQILNPSPPSSNQPPPPSQESVQTEGGQGQVPAFDTASASNGIAGAGGGTTIGAGGGIPFDPSNFPSSTTTGAFDPLNLGNWEEGLNDLDWLNTVDWSRGPWRLDLGGQDFPAAAGLKWN